MIAIDTNILVYAHREDGPFHKIAYKKLKGLSESAELWGIPWPCIHEFIAIVTNPRIYKKPTPLNRVFEQLEAWMASPTFSLLTENDSYWPVLKDMIHKVHVTGCMVHDCRIACVCLVNGVKVLWTADRDFSRLSGIEFVNPLK